MTDYLAIQQFLAQTNPDTPTPEILEGLRRLGVDITEEQFLNWRSSAAVTPVDPAAWSEAEHVSETAVSDTQQILRTTRAGKFPRISPQDVRFLIDKTGTVEHAQHAIEVANRRQQEESHRISPSGNSPADAS